MTVLIYLLFAVGLVAFAVTCAMFLKMWWSGVQLRFKTAEEDRQWPWIYFLNGGLPAAFRAFPDNRYGHLQRAFRKNLLRTIAAFAITMGAFGFIVELNKEHCVFPMTERTFGGTATVICGPGN